jgi:excisionase family DNA binding protein
MKMTNNEFLSINEFAELIRVHPNTVRNMINSGRLSAFRTSNSEKASYRIAKSEIQRLAVVDLDKIVENLVEKRSKK